MFNITCCATKQGYTTQTADQCFLFSGDMAYTTPPAWTEDRLPRTFAEGSGDQHIKAKCSNAEDHSTQYVNNKHRGQLHGGGVAHVHERHVGKGLDKAWHGQAPYYQELYGV